MITKASKRHLIQENRRSICVYLRLEEKQSYIFAV